jgi:hypothetical protein
VRAAVNTREVNQAEAKIVAIKDNGYCGLRNNDDPTIPVREFNFDYTYDDDSIQSDVYQNLGAPLLDKAFGGWNGTIFAYGQTGAGKSFSMTGSSSMPGIIPQMNAEMVCTRRRGRNAAPWPPPARRSPARARLSASAPLCAAQFERIGVSTAENPNKLFLVTCSFMEICTPHRPRPKAAPAHALPRRRALSPTIPWLPLVPAQTTRCCTICSTRRRRAARASRARTRTST